jgi:hypothetical protein
MPFGLGGDGKSASLNEPLLFVMARRRVVCAARQSGRFDSYLGSVRGTRQRTSMIVVAEPPIARVIYQDHENGPHRQDQIRVLISGTP